MTDYDRTDMPVGYDRGRDHGPEVLDLWMQTLAAHFAGSPARILDLGCGTGRFTGALAHHFDAEVIGIDPSQKMLEQARAKPHHGHVRYQLARAEAMPLRSGSIDIIFMSMSLHHFNDRALAAAECRRVLAEDGRVFVRTGTREQIQAYPYYPFFPASHAILAEVLPSIDAIQGLFERARFRLTCLELIHQTIAPSWAVYADKLEANADSVLAQLERADFDRGIAAIREHAVLVKDQPIVEPIDLFVFRA